MKPQEAIGLPASPYLTMAEAAVYIRLTVAHPARAAYKFLVRNNVPLCYRGRTPLVERRVLDDYLRGETWTRRRSA